MRVIVKLFATLAESRPGVEAGEPFDVLLREKATVADLIRHLELLRDEARLIFVNGRMEEAGFQLKEGDEVGMFPPIGGG